MSTLEIIGFPQSTYVRSVRMACEEKGVAYELVLVGPHSPQVNAIHPFGKIPVMRHDGFALCESKAIASYLDAVFPGPRLMPSDPKGAALAEQWVSLINTAMDPVLIRSYLFAYIFPKGEGGTPDRAAIEAVLPKMREQIALLDRTVGREGYLAGPTLSFADLTLLPIIFYLQQFPESQAAIAEARALSAWYQRLAARPSFAKTMPPPRRPN
jgi:glutathione S-transferase